MHSDKGKRNLTIKDVAKAAGVSYATVSRAMTKSKEISPRTREHILRVADEIGYRPNGIARSLVNKRSRTIALIVPDISYSFFSEIALAAEDEANSRGYCMFLCNSRWDVENEEKLLWSVQENCVDGIIMHLASDDLRNIEGLRLPLVLLSYKDGPQFSTVGVDNISGGRDGTQSLIANGYRRIACLTGIRGFTHYTERVEGYIEAIQNAGMPVDPSIIAYDVDGWEPGYETAKRLLESTHPPDAFFCGNDLIAMGVWQAAVDCGREVPRDVGVCGFDNSSIASLPQTQMTSVAQPVDQIGKKAAEMLFERIRGGAGKPIQSLVLPTKLIERNSSQRAGRATDV